MLHLTSLDEIAASHDELEALVTESDGRMVWSSTVPVKYGIQRNTLENAKDTAEMDTEKIQEQGIGARRKNRKWRRR